MDGIVVTKKSNVEVDEDGKFIINDLGELQLIDFDDVGVLIKTHIIPMNQLDENGHIQQGFLPRCEVYWDKVRSPAPSLEVPEDLVWLALGTEEDEDFDPDDGPDGEALESEVLEDVA